MYKEQKQITMFWKGIRNEKDASYGRKTTIIPAKGMQEQKTLKVSGKNPKPGTFFT